MLVFPKHLEAARAALANVPGVTLIQMEYEDAWLRDIGMTSYALVPWLVSNRKGLVCQRPDLCRGAQGQRAACYQLGIQGLGWKPNQLDAR